MNLKRLQCYMKEMINWLLEARLALLFGSILLLAGLISFYTWPTEQSIRITGYALQLLGMVFAIRGVMIIREYFGHPTIKSMLISWLKRIPKWRKRGKFISSSVSTSINVKVGNLESWSRDKPEETLEKRLEAVLEKLDILRMTQENHSDEISKIKIEHKNYYETQKNEIITVKNELNIKLEKIHTDDILVSLIGLIWLTVGLTLSTLSFEILQFTK